MTVNERRCLWPGVFRSRPVRVIAVTEPGKLLALVTTDMATPAGQLGRPKNTYVREDQILPHLAAAAILLARGSQRNGDGTRQLTTPTQAAALVDQLRTAGVILTYDPGTLTMRTHDDDPIAVTTGRNR